MAIEQTNLFDPRVHWNHHGAVRWRPTIFIVRDIFLLKQANTLIFIPYGKYLLI